MPSEPAESNFKNKVRARAYPTQERKGIIWAYMGPREVPPPLPDIEANLLCEGPHQISILHRPCNWMQGLEGEMDTVHAALLHFGAVKFEDQARHVRALPLPPARRQFVTVETDSAWPTALRPAEDDSYYWRVTQILFPFYLLPGASWARASASAPTCPSMTTTTSSGRSAFSSPTASRWGPATVLVLRR
jgi:phenylpropionate dioxygenase-like ring-hydroxylating dioxygenase large terminal subunit